MEQAIQCYHSGRLSHCSKLFIHDIHLCWCVSCQTLFFFYFFIQISNSLNERFLHRLKTKILDLKHSSVSVCNYLFQFESKSKVTLKFRFQLRELVSSLSNTPFNLLKMGAEADRDTSMCGAQHMCWGCGGRDWGWVATIHLWCALIQLYWLKKLFFLLTNAKNFFSGNY